MEKVAYNSMPAHTTADLRQITYYQLPNQITCVRGNMGFADDHDNDLVPGPFSGFPCCCYNWHMGWPKFTQGLWMATAEGGLAAAAYAPCRVETVVGETNVTIEETTDYPFRETVTFTVTPEKPASFPLTLRVPGWCEAAELTVNGEKAEAGEPGEFFAIDRQWRAGDTVTLRLPMEVRTSRWAEETVAFERGPLVFSLRIKEDRTVVNDYQGEFDEFEVRPGSPWNYAVDPGSVSVSTAPVSEMPFSTDAPAVTLTAAARRVPQWGTKSAMGTAIVGRANYDYTPLGEAPAPVAVATPQRVKIVRKGGTLTLFVGGSDEPSLTREGLSTDAGAVGFRMYQSEASFDDISINGRPVDLKAGGVKPVDGQWSVKNGVLKGRATGGGKAVLTPGTTYGDFTLEMTVTLAESGDAGVMFGATGVKPQLDGYRGTYVGFRAGGAGEHTAAEPPVSPVAGEGPVRATIRRSSADRRRPRQTARRKRRGGRSGPDRRPGDADPQSGQTAVLRDRRRHRADPAAVQPRRPGPGAVATDGRARLRGPRRHRRRHLEDEHRRTEREGHGGHPALQGPRPAAGQAPRRAGPGTAGPPAVAGPDLHRRRPRPVVEAGRDRQIDAADPRGSRVRGGRNPRVAHGGRRGPRRSRSARITTPSTWTSRCGSRWNCTSSG